MGAVADEDEPLAGSIEMLTDIGDNLLLGFEIQPLRRLIENKPRRGTKQGPSEAEPPPFPA